MKKPPTLNNQLDRIEIMQCGNGVIVRMNHFDGMIGDNTDRLVFETEQALLDYIRGLFDFSFKPNEEIVNYGHAKLVCGHISVTVSGEPSEGHCTTCGVPMVFDRVARKWVAADSSEAVLMAHRRLCEHPSIVRHGDTNHGHCANCGIPMSWIDPSVKWVPSLADSGSTSALDREIGT